LFTNTSFKTIELKLLSNSLLTLRLSNANGPTKHLILNRLVFR